jgi:hypothetical protein
MAAFMDIVSQDGTTTDEDRSKLKELLLQVTKSGRNIPLDLEPSIFGDKNEARARDVINALFKKIQSSQSQSKPSSNTTSATLPKVITFPYSRHSSYPELCHLVDVLQPRDIWPCTVQPQEWLRKGISIESLFGTYCSAAIFEYDGIFNLSCKYPRQDMLDMNPQSQSDSQHSFFASSPPVEGLHYGPPSSAQPSEQMLLIQQNSQRGEGLQTANIPSTIPYPRVQGVDSSQRRPDTQSQQSQQSHFAESILPGIAGNHEFARADAYHAMSQNIRGEQWATLGLLCRSDNHTSVDRELGA